MAKGKKSGVNKKCKTCSLDCVVTRAIAVESAKRESSKTEIIKVMFGDGKPKYSQETCPKR